MTAEQPDKAIPQKVLDLARAIAAAGGRALLIGGCVRDTLMGRPVKDFDVEVFGIEPDRLPAILDNFGQVNAVGQAFKVYKIGSDLDVSLPRRDRKIGTGHRGFEVDGDPAMSTQEAARRRDFTINAIFEDPLTGEIIDHFGGREDIKDKVLRVVSAETFPEDSLRVLRAVQFASRLEFEIEPATVELCRSIDLSDLPSERIWGEIEKLLLHSRMPSVGLDWLVKLGISSKLFPEIEALRDVPQEPEWHPEGDVFVHTALVIDRAREEIELLDGPRKVTLMLAALCHDFGKPSTTEFLEGRWRSRGHEEAGVAPTTSFLNTLNVHTLEGFDVRKQVIALVKDHLKPGEFFKKQNEVGDGAFRRLAARCELELLYRVAKADSLGRNAPWVPQDKWFDAEAQEWFINRARELAVEKRPPEKILLGRHLIEMGVDPGPEMGEILRVVYEMQLDGKVTSIDDARDAARRLITAA